MILHFSVDENAPCIGVCYHNKKKAMDENCADYDRGWPLNAKEFGVPCVGICHMLREMNIPNPGYLFQHTGEETTPSPSLFPNQSKCLC